MNLVTHRFFIKIRGYRFLYVDFQQESVINYVTYRSFIKICYHRFSYADSH